MSNRFCQSSDLRCVIADDVRMIREQLGRWMESLGFSVTHTTCGAAALAAIRQLKPDIVVTDIDMPDFSGLHLLQILRADSDDEISAVPMIVASSLEDPGVNRVIERFDASVFLRKPINKRRFIMCVERLARGDEVHSDASATEPHQISSRFRKILASLDQAECGGETEH